MDDNDPARPRQHPVFRAQGNRGGSRTPRNSESEPAQGGQDLEEEITIPDVSGQSLEEAVKSISGTGFDVAAIETETNRRDPETVIRTNLTARTPAKPGAPVTLTRSAGGRARESVGLSSALRDSWALVYGLVGLAGVTARRGGPGRAARLFGAAKAMGEAASVTVAFSPAQALYEQDLANVRAQPDPGPFKASWEESQAMTLEEAVAVALAEGA